MEHRIRNVTYHAAIIQPKTKYQYKGKGKVPLIFCPNPPKNENEKKDGQNKKK